MAGEVGNPVRAWLRIEALVLFVGATLVWIGLDGGWTRYALGFLLPDLSIAAYLIGPRAGAAAYNAAHSYAIPAILAIVGAMLDHPALMLVGALWTSHLAFDRMLGFGLKYPTSFGDTHLGPVGRARRALQLPLGDVSITGTHVVPALAAPTPAPLLTDSRGARVNDLSLQSQR